MSAPPALAVTNLRKDYRALRPLRIASLVVHPEERVAVVGLDAAAAELIVNLVTGATLPDEGDIRVFGARTADIVSETAWLAWLDRIGIVSPRAVLVEGMTLAQNLALPFTLEVDPVRADVRPRLDALAAEVDLPPAGLDVPAGEASPGVRARLHLARALALDPSLVLLEQPAALVPADDLDDFAGVLQRVARRRSLAVLVLLARPPAGAPIADRVLTLRPGTGTLDDARGWRRWV